MCIWIYVVNIKMENSSIPYFSFYSFILVLLNCQKQMSSMCEHDRPLVNLLQTSHPSFVLRFLARSPWLGILDIFSVYFKMAFELGWELSNLFIYCSNTAGIRVLLAFLCTGGWCSSLSKMMQSWLRIFIFFVK